MNLKFRITLLMAMLMNVCLFAQETYTLTGKVLSQADNEPLPGVSVRIQNTTSGTETDFDGNYTIQVKSGIVLEISWLLYSVLDSIYIPFVILIFLVKQNGHG